MQCVRKINEDMYWIGAEDRRLALFENLFPIPRGIAYNSYLIKDEKNVLIDTVDYSVGRQFLDNLKYALNGQKLDYLIVNHMEPDHCSLIEELIYKYPEMKIICNAQTIRMIKQFYNFDVDSKVEIVKEGQIFKTGKHEFQFIMAPMVHWPEVMVTYDMTDKILFSADAFGSFGALNGNLFNDDIDFEKEWLSDARRYYTNIVGKYGPQVQNLLKKASNIEIKMICPLHGIIWRNNLEYIIEKYDKWSKYEPEKNSVLIVYSSVYGNTENVVNTLSNYLGENGIKEIAVYDSSNTDVSQLVSESFKYSNIVIAATTYNLGVFPAIENYLVDIKRLNLQNRTISIIENSTWVPGIVTKEVKNILSEMKNMEVLENTFSIKSSAKDNEYEYIKNIGDEIIKDLKKRD
ncbi:MAG: FprA family A-type flavoprotein [Clostridia bacterium]|jgi:flavorubredoxin|nr:FprA family A-type flavoprotein [Clostridia bacterium]